MRDYGRISPAFWTKGSGKRLRGQLDAQVLGMYLLSCASANMLGLYYLPIVTIAYETGLSIEAVRVAFAKTEAAGFALYDEEADLVWVPNAPQHEFGDALELRDNRRKWIEKQLKALPPHRFVDDFYARYGDLFSLNCARDKESRLIPSKGANGRGFEGASTAPIEGVRNQDQDPEQEQEQEQERESATVVALVPAVVTGVALQKVAKRRKASLPLPPDFAVSVAARDLAAAEGVDPDRELAKMRDWANGKDEHKADWESAFRGWLRRAGEDVKNRGRPPPGRIVQPFDADAPWMKAGS